MAKKVKTDLRQERFPYEYVIDLNGQKAAERAGYSSKTARSQASRLLTKRNIQEKIKELQGRLNEDALMSAQEADRRASVLARVNFKDYYNENGELKPMKDLTEDQAYCLKEVTLIETELGSHLKVKTTDPHAVLRTIYERRGLLKQNVDITGQINLIRIKSNVKG